MRRLALLPAILLAACAAKQPPAPPAGDTSEPTLGSCDATKAQFAIGQRYTPELEAALHHRANAQVVRALKPNQPATMEFNPARLSVQLTAQNRVKALSCG